ARLEPRPDPAHRGARGDRPRRRVRGRRARRERGRPARRPGQRDPLRAVHVRRQRARPRGLDDVSLAPVPLVSIVVPVFDESKNVEPLHRALEVVRGEMKDVELEYVFVDDGSKDDSLLVLAKLAGDDPKVKVVALARNFGKELALTAGVTYAKGDAVVTMDADLQHPPALLPCLVVKWRAGAEVVVAKRSSTKRKAILRRLGSRLFAIVARMVASNDAIEEGGTDYRLIDKKVRAAFLLVRERRRAYRQIVDWLGFKRE